MKNHIKLPVPWFGYLRFSKKNGFIKLQQKKNGNTQGSKLAADKNGEDWRDYV
jgi:hypothetical protein